MDFGSVLYESMDRVATITLNRPERFNAISENICLTILPQLLSRLFLKETPEILYGAVETKTGQDQLKARQSCWVNNDLVCPQKNQWKLFHSNFH